MALLPCLVSLILFPKGFGYHVTAILGLFIGLSCSHKAVFVTTFQLSCDGFMSGVGDAG